jgi:hypothetical protein
MAGVRAKHALGQGTFLGLAPLINELTELAARDRELGNKLI